MTANTLTPTQDVRYGLTLDLYAEVVSREVARLDAADLLPIPADLLRWHFERNVPALVAAADIAAFTS